MQHFAMRIDGDGALALGATADGKDLIRCHDTLGEQTLAPLRQVRLGVRLAVADLIAGEVLATTFEFGEPVDGSDIGDGVRVSIAKA